MIDVATSSRKSKPLGVNAAVLVDSDAYDRMRCVLRHMAVGLVDQSIRFRWLSEDPRVASLSLGPVDATIHRPIRWPRRSRGMSELVAAFEANPPTIVHAMSHGSYSLAAALALTFDADLVLQITSQRDCDLLGEVDLTRVGRFIPLSEPLADVLNKQVGIEPSRIVLIRPGVRTQTAAAGFGDALRTITMLSTTPFDKQHGLDRLVEAIDALARRGHSLMVFMVGRGPYESTLRRLVHDRGLLPRVTFGRGLEDPGETMHGADLFIETSPLAEFREDVLQAMAAGLVVVAAANPAVDHLRDEETAFVASRTSAQSLLQTLERVLGNQAAAHRLAESAQRYVREHHTVSAMAEQLASTYRSLVVNRTTFPLPE